jgi:hypothetical protein
VKVSRETCTQNNKTAQNAKIISRAKHLQLQIQV